MPTAIGIGIGICFGSGGVAAPIPEPPETLGANLILRCRSDVGTAASWTDQVGGAHFVQGTGANQPTINATGGPNGTPSFLFDGVDNYMVSPINLPAPGTTPTYLWLIFRQVTWTSGRRLLNSGTANRMHFLQTGATPQINSGNGVNYSNTNATVNTYRRAEVLWNNAASDYFKIGSVETTGAGMGNTDPAANLTLGADNAAANFGNLEICEILIANAAPSAGQRTQLDTYASARYGAGVLA